MRLWQKTLLCCFGTGAALTTADVAFASGFATARFGGEHGHPTTDNPTAIYYNPAGIAEDTPGFEKKFWRVKIFADANLALRWASWSHQLSPKDEPEPEGAQGANSGTGELFNAVTAPMAGATFQVENFGIGLGWFVPFGGQSVYDENEAFKDNPNFAGPVDGVQRWHSIQGVIRSMYFSVAAAYDILDRVSIGAAFNVVKSDVDTLRARTADGSNNLTTEGRSWIDVGGWHATFGVGVIGEVAEEKVWIGASYQARPALGEMQLSGTLNTNLSGTVSEQEVKLIQELPDVFRMGVRARPVEKVEIRVFGDVTTWGTFDNQCVITADKEECPVNEDGSADPASGILINIARNWGTAFGVRAGGSYWVIPELELYLGAGYDSNAVPDETLEVALTDFHKASVAGGLRFNVGELFAAALTYTHLFYAPRDTTGESIHPDFEPPTRSPDSGGKYTQTIGVINANVQFSF
jgi:long-chain fatty acid transport protein